jgi:hypothetical protein
VTLGSLENHAGLVALVGSSTEKMYRVQQAALAAQHVRQLSQAAQNLGHSIDSELTDFTWRIAREHFSHAARRQDVCSCLVIQDLVASTVLATLYQTLEQTGTKALRTLSQSLFQECQTSQMLGIKTIQALLAINPERVHDSVVWAHHRVMAPWWSTLTQIEGLATYADLNEGLDDTGPLSPTDLRTLYHQNQRAYVATLLATGLDPRVVTPLASPFQTPSGDSALGFDFPGSTKAEEGGQHAMDAALS